MFAEMRRFGENPIKLAVDMSAGHKYVVRKASFTKTPNAVIFKGVSSAWVILMVSLKGFLNRFVSNSSSLRITSSSHPFCTNVFKTNVFDGLGLKWNKMSLFSFVCLGLVAKKLTATPLKQRKHKQFIKKQQQKYTQILSIKHSLYIIWVWFI